MFRDFYYCGGSTSHYEPQKSRFDCFFFVRPPQLSTPPESFQKSSKHIFEMAWKLVHSKCFSNATEGSSKSNSYLNKQPADEEGKRSILSVEAVVICVERKVIQVKEPET